MPARPFSRRQALQNAAFLEALRETGNPRLAARLLGVHRSTYLKRRAKNAAFAQDSDAALAAAHARFHLGGGPRPPEGQPLRTRGGELFVGRTRGGRLQLCRAPPGWMTKAAEQAFFAALSATANVRLSAAAAGFAHSSFYAKARVRTAFAREMRLALAMGCERIEWALTERAFQALGEGGGWRAAAGDENPLPKMTIDQCIQLVALRGRRDGRREPPALHDDSETGRSARGRDNTYPSLRAPAKMRRSPCPPGMAATCGASRPCASRLGR